MSRTIQKRVNFVVTDLDDTIWDWLSMWYNSFYPFLERISREYNIDKTELKRDFKKLHEKYDTSEASFIVEELESLNDQQKKDIFKETNNKSVIHEYYSRKKSGLELYDGVLKTLTSIKSKGTKIVGFTESQAFYTKYRLKTLNLDGLIDCIYAPIDFGIPDSVRRVYPEGYWEPEKTEFRYLPKEVKKPNVEILEIILKDFKAQKENTIYIGDKLDRDVYMAKETGITAVYAKYGHKIVGTEYDLLKEVTHWSSEDVAREVQFKNDFEGKTINPDVVLENSISELDIFFEFYQFESSISKENTKDVVDIWKKVVDVQQHFNDIELRIRNYALTIFTATVTGIGFLEKEKIEFTFNSLTIPASALLGLLGLFVLLAFWYMDRYWYHKLLLGAVKQGIYIEDKYSFTLPEMQLTKAIGESSPQRFLKRKGKHLIKIHSSKKYWIFYGLIIVPLLFLCIVLIMTHKKTHFNSQAKHTIQSSMNLSRP
jgi:FMN phosphatase YigB (HAD superfamily)